MRKQGLFILLLLMSLCSMMRAQRSFTYGGLNYTVLSEADGTAIVGKQDASLSGDVTIRATVYDSSTELFYTVVAVGESAFLDTKITSVTFPTGVIKSIGTRAFKNCTELSSLTIPSSVTSIGDWAFADCSSLTSVTIPNSVTSISSGTFNGCWSLTSVTIPNSVTSIGDNAFASCISLTSVTIPNSVTSIGYAAFSSCSSLTSITIPNSVTSIGNEAFRSCRSLTSVTIPNSVTSIGNYAFYFCSSLTSVTIPNSVTSIRDWAFGSCSSLTSVTIPNSVTSIGGAAFRSCSSLTSVTIPNSVTSIGYEAFGYCSSLTSVTIPNSVTSIGNEAFYSCSSLTSVTIPNSVTSIGDAAFADCSSLTSVTIPNSVTSIRGGAFYSCSSLTSVTIPNSVTSIGDNALDGCAGLTSLVIPAGVSSIGQNALANCTGLKWVVVKDGVSDIAVSADAFSGMPATTILYVPAGKRNEFADNSVWSTFKSIIQDDNITFADSNVKSVCVNNWDTNEDGELSLVEALMVTSLGQKFRENTAIISFKELEYFRSLNTLNDDFYGCSSLTSVTIPNSVTSIGNKAFRYCSSLTSVTIPNSVTSIGNYAFASCSSLTSVTIPNSVASIGNYAFASCSSLTSVTIPNSVTSIGNGAFRSCSSLTSVTIPNAVTSIEDYAFDSCSSLTSVTIPNSVTSIGNYAFASCSSLTSVTIPNSVTSIGNEAFYSCSSLTSVTIPNSVTSIGDGAFDSCSSLTSVTIPNSVTSISNNTFNGCKALTSIILPEKLNSIGDYALNGCAGLTSLVIPAGVSYIGQNALANCTGLKWVVVKDGVYDIAVGADAFSGMPATTILYVPAGKRSEFVNHYNWKIFKSIIQDDNITFADSNVKSVCINNWDTNEDGELSLVEALMVTSLGQKFRENTAIISFKELQYFRSLNTLNDDFRGCSNLVDIKFPNSIKNIGDSTFKGCNKLTLADGLPENLEYIGIYAFSGCYNLGDIYIPKTVTYIDYRAFRESNPLSLTVDPDNTIFDSRNNCNAIIEKRDDGLLVGCSKTVIPEGVKYLNWYSFSGRKGLEYIVIPEGIEHVGNRTFLGTDLHSVTLPSTIKIIGENAFEGCEYLKEIVINTSGTVAIEKDAFPEGADGMKIYAKKGFKANNLKPLTVGLGSWETQVMYDYIKVTELVSGRNKVIAEEHFNTDAMDNWEVHGGTWEMSNGNLCQTSLNENCMITLKNMELPAKYKYNIRAQRTGGNEGFLAVVNFENESNWQWWNIGGWQNTKHCLEYAPSGCSNYIGNPVKGGVIVGDWNDIEIIVDNQYITCILNGDTIHKNVVNTKHNYWKNYTIYEHDESNVVSAKEAVGRNGGKIIVPVELKNEKEVYQFQCDVIVPEGISLDAIKASSIRANSHTAEMSKVEDNHYRITMINTQNVPITGNSGELLKIVLNVSETILEGDYNLRLTDIILADKSYVDINVPYCISNLSVDNSANVGDVNNDGKITVTDVMLLVDYILELNTVPITDIVADVNGDGKVTVTDVQLLVDIILEKNISSAKIKMFQVREPE